MDHGRNDAKISAAFIKIAKQREITLDDMKDIFEGIKLRDEKRFTRETQRLKECTERRENLTVYYVFNKADRKLTVLGKSSSCAPLLAKTTGHIHEEKNGRVMVLKEKHE